MKAQRMLKALEREDRKARSSAAQVWHCVTCLMLVVMATTATNVWAVEAHCIPSRDADTVAVNLENEASFLLDVVSCEPYMRIVPHFRRRDMEVALLDVNGERSRFVAMLRSRRDLCDCIEAYLDCYKSSASPFIREMLPIMRRRYRAEAALCKSADEALVVILERSAYAPTPSDVVRYTDAYCAAVSAADSTYEADVERCSDRLAGLIAARYCASAIDSSAVDVLAHLHGAREYIRNNAILGPACGPNGIYNTLVEVRIAARLCRAMDAASEIIVETMKKQNGLK